MKSVFTKTGGLLEMTETNLDPRIVYPCYKSFDEFIDVEKLLSLDSYITERIERHIAEAQDDFFCNEHRLEDTMPYQPGVREIWLSRTKPQIPYDYLDLDKAELWELTEEADEFARLMDFIETLPFQTKGRMLIIYDDAGQAVPPHQDHLSSHILHDFIWFRTNLKKPFYMLNHQTGEKKYVESYSAWFDTVNQFHGSDGYAGLSFSIRVDGKFTDEFKEKIPRPEINPASTPALWANTVSEF